MKQAGIRALLDRGRRWTRGSRNQLSLPSPKAAGIYVDVENLKNVEYARFVIGAIIRNWPDSLPPIRRLCIYVPADRTGLWRTWVTGGFPHMETLVRGIQHYARKSKNSADMAIVADAIADFAAGAVHHVSVVSNDSDFGALFEKLRELVSLTGETAQPPFLWILPEGSTLSREIADFFPGELLWSPPEQRVRQVREPAGHGNSGIPTNGEIVRWLLNEIPVGKFRAEDVLNIVRQRCPDHSAVRNLPVWGRSSPGTCCRCLATR